MSRALRVLAMLAALGFLATAVTWVAGGGRWYIVDSPSMGTAAPVGTLLWSKPVERGDLHPGDFITFVPPGRSQKYSHRILAIHPDGTISTKGQITSADPWLLHEQDVLGKVEARWWGIGWLVRALPYLLVGAALTWLVTRRIRPGRRLPVTVLGAAIAISIAITVLHPLTGAERLDGGGTNGRGVFVSTGLLPIRLTVEGVGHVNLSAGQVGTIDSPAVGTADATLTPHLSLWWWVALIALWLLPATVVTIRSAMRRTPGPRHLAVHA